MSEEKKKTTRKPAAARKNSKKAASNTGEETPKAASGKEKPGVRKTVTAKKAAPKRTETAKKTSGAKDTGEQKPVRKKTATVEQGKAVVAKDLKKEKVFSGSSEHSAEKPGKVGPTPEVPVTAEAAELPAAEDALSPLERKLAGATLPELPRENRARLQMQSPTRLYFYWSIRSNPFQTLGKAFGGSTGNYTLVVKLVNESRGSEEMYAVEPEGNWWFNVEPDCVYRAEVGFYSPSRPYIRIVFSNLVKTPRRSPSWRTDYVPRFTVTADQFAEVLDASGYSRDAFEVALAGDDRDSADEFARSALRGLLGKAGFALDDFDGDELRFILLALASGYSIEELEGHISKLLFEKLVASGIRVSPEQALTALKENFDVETEEITEFEETGPAVFGLSAIHFPVRKRTRRVPKKLLSKLSKFDTVSSSR